MNYLSKINSVEYKEKKIHFLGRSFALNKLIYRVD